MLHQSVEKLRSMRLPGMARALEAQLAQADSGRLSFDERLAMLIDREKSTGKTPPLPCACAMQSYASQPVLRTSTIANRGGWTALCCKA
jgi:hypothetical protein